MEAFFSGGEQQGSSNSDVSIRGARFCSQILRVLLPPPTTAVSGVNIYQIMLVICFCFAKYVKFYL